MRLQQFIVLLVVVRNFQELHGGIRYTNIRCLDFNKTLVAFVRCDLKVVGRGLIALNVHAKVNYPQPISNATMNISLFKKANGYRPFLYNSTMDFCDFLKNRKRYPFVKIYWDTVLQNTNLNHTCPYNHDIIVRNTTLNEDMFKYMPLPSGDYLFKLRVAIYNYWVAEDKLGGQ
ncbi:uncharacterized protein LOC142233378 [Haematobia irritans]|uniref:uncharacterized protein LOC142233378 n=1 Tax=Haematobia irritans TaxID=7368 RepID=UPI003F4FE481